MLQENPTGQKTECLMNLRNEFFIQATLPSTEYIYLDVGLGVHPQYTLSEALGVIAMLETDLNRKADEYTTKMTEVRSRIKLMLHGISQLTDAI
jgi:prefoldin subunit 5